MELDDDLCVCFHVSRRKVVNFLRVEKPQRVGQLADCFGAGTGCGWCRPFLQRLFRRRPIWRVPGGDRPPVRVLGSADRLLGICSTTRVPIWTPGLASRRPGLGRAQTRCKFRQANWRTARKWDTMSPT